MVCRGVGGATALADEDVVKEQCADTSLRTFGSVQCCHPREVAAPLPPPCPPPWACVYARTCLCVCKCTCVCVCVCVKNLLKQSQH